MRQSIVDIALVVRDYDEAIDFYVGSQTCTVIHGPAAVACRPSDW